MVNLITPDKNKHKFIVGIDFGHGETSAAMCPIEWDKDAGQRETKILDIDLDLGGKKVITSAICRIQEGIFIGDEAFEHMTNNNGIRVCFKQKPKSLDGSAEQLMMDFMNTVYGRIRENRKELEDGNHIVYIARPSGWVEEEAKELYRHMAIKAGIPLGGLTSESRAAIFYAKSPWVNFAREISKGAIVFDLGSSTLDFTYLSDSSKPIDFGYNLGASIIDEVILNEMILCNNDVKKFIKEFPAYHDALKFQARKFKELAYSRNPDIKTIDGFPLSNITSDNEEIAENYTNVYVPLKIKNLAELNEKINASTNYIEKLGEALDDFRATKIPDKTINGVFITGGASRMNFIHPLIAEHFHLSKEQVKTDGDNPSLTISKGIALLGATDAITTILVTELKKSLPAWINNDNLLNDLIDSLAFDITIESWVAVESSCNEWVNYGKTRDSEELKKRLQQDMLSFQQYKVPHIINNTLQTFIKNKSEDIRKRMNEIISRYAPGREIATFGSVKVKDIQAINNSLDNMSVTISEICDSITSVLSQILWAALGLFLFGIFSVAYYLIKGVYNFFRDDKDVRKDKAAKLLEEELNVTTQMEEKLRTELRNSTTFKNAVTFSLNNYFTKLIDSNLQQVMIPIE